MPAPVKMRTTIEDAGVLYEVLIGERIVWGERVFFGNSDATNAGGAAFQMMAREQENRAWTIHKRLNPSSKEMMEEVSDTRRFGMPRRLARSAEPLVEDGPHGRTLIPRLVPVPEDPCKACNNDPQKCDWQDGCQLLEP